MMLIVRDEAARVLLQRRPPTGVWSGMWSLPEVADHDEARDFVARHTTADFDANTPLPLIEHTFSHYRLHIAAACCGATRQARRGSAIMTSSAGMRWTRWMKSALPAPVRKLLLGLR